MDRTRPDRRFPTADYARPEPRPAAPDRPFAHGPSPPDVDAISVGRFARSGGQEFPLRRACLCARTRHSRTTSKLAIASGPGLKRSALEALTNRSMRCTRLRRAVRKAVGLIPETALGTLSTVWDVLHSSGTALLAFDRRRREGACLAAD